MSALQDPYFFYTGTAGLFLLGVLALAVTIRDARLAARAPRPGHPTACRHARLAIGAVRPTRRRPGRLRPDLRGDRLRRFRGGGR
jgi:hypothetical protein